MKIKGSLLSIVTVCSLFTHVDLLLAQGTAFTYQGQLQKDGNFVNGNYDLRLQLWNDSTAGSLIGGPVTNTMVAVSNGLFTTVIDFGSGVFTGGSNWLHIGVRTNGSGGFTGLTPRQQLTPTPYAIYAESANAAGLTGTVPLGDLTGVALLVGGNIFTGNQTVNGTVQVNGPEQITGPSGAGYHVDENIGPNTYYSGEEHAINFNYAAGASQNIGSLIMGWNGQGYFSVGNLYTSIGQSGTKAFSVFGQGNVNVDPMGMNSGFLNNGNTNSSGLTFGVGSGEGIASQRQTGLPNQYGLDFYTSFTKRLSIDNTGNLLIPSDSQSIRFPASSGANSPMIEMFASGTLNADRMVIAHSPSYPTWGLQYQDNGDRFNFLQGGTTVMTVNLSQYTPLVVNGNFAVVNGFGNEQAYMGGDGSGGDVQFGSLNSAIDNVAFYNAAKNTYMHIYCSSITIEGGADLAEPFKITSGKDEVPQGAVVVIDEQNPGHLKLSDQAYDTRVAGVVSGANGVNPGIQMQQQGILEGGKNVALTGRVYVQADTSNGAIRPGDLLTTSGTPGRAMRVTDHAKAQGAILGKAMTGLTDSQGMVLVLVTLQ